MPFAKKIAAALFVICTFVASSTEADQRLKVLTPISADDMVQVLRKAHVDQVGRQPSDSRLAMGWAQVSLENGRGRATWNHNLGNIGPGRRDRGDWYWHTPYVKYKSFASFIDSGRSYWHTVSKCSSAIAAFDAGLPVQAALSLKRCGYYGAPVSAYSRALTNLYYNGLARVESQGRRLKEEQNAQHERLELEQRRPFTPACGCCVWE